MANKAAINSLANSYFKPLPPELDLPYTVFPIDIAGPDSFMMGMLVPACPPIQVVPGDNFYEVKLAGVIRTGSALVAPVLGDMYYDVFAFWVPDRIVWNHLNQFYGENDQLAWTDTNVYDKPNANFRGTSYTSSNLGHQGTTLPSGVTLGNYFLNPHFGLPFKAHSDTTITVLEHRGYYSLWNEYFRDPSWQRPVLFSKGDIGNAGEFGYVLGPNGYDFVDNTGTDIPGVNVPKLLPFGRSITDVNSALLMPVNRFTDSFTTIRPEPSFGDPVDLLKGLTAPVGIISSQTVTSSTSAGPYAVAGSQVAGDFYQYVGASGAGVSPIAEKVIANLNNVGLYVDRVRAGILLQNYQDILARTDQRANQIIETLFGLDHTELNSDRPVLLGHSRHRVGVNQVVATADSSTGSGTFTSHLGETGAFSLTGIDAYLFGRKFTEPGYIHIVYCVRQKNTYSQGIPEQFRRIKQLDNYNPVFDKKGYEPFYAQYVTAEADPDFIVGYQKGWYPYKTNRLFARSALDPAISGSFDFWTLGTVYTSFQIGSSVGPGTFIQGPEELDRVLLDGHKTTPQFVCDLKVYGKVGRKISADSDPLFLGIRM